MLSKVLKEAASFHSIMTGSLELRLTAHELRLIAHELRLTAHELRLTAHELRLTTHELHLTTHEPSGPPRQPLITARKDIGSPADAADSSAGKSRGPADAVHVRRIPFHRCALAGDVLDIACRSGLLAFNCAVQAVVIQGDALD